MWDSLQVTHEGNKVIKENKIQLFKVQYDVCKMEERETVAEYIFRINDLINNMRALGEDVKDVDVCKKILRSLTSRFNPKVTILEDKDLFGMKIDELQASLTAYEMRIVILAVYRREAALKAKEVIEETKTNCGKPGHVVSHCPNSKRQSQKKNEEGNYKGRFGRKVLISDWNSAPEEDKFEETQEDEVEKGSDTEIKEILEECERLAVKDKWYVDSGCSRQMTGNGSKFNSLKQFDSGNVIFGDNQRTKIVRILTVSKSKELPKIQEVLLVEGLKHNLLSVS
ncbi:uncharacterized protein LOC132313818 [Cornus florida]|uniref:uncharacterized protein LOC132313818 n=1 Tax=Cornus florida TaxID=4283 RepID=UPI002899EF1B|nr:uncharacterized protein LOC132313818 [Cornus florida]